MPLTQNLLHIHTRHALDTRPRTAGAAARVRARRRAGIDVLAVDVLGCGDERGSLFSACVSLLETVELDFVAERVHETVETHCGWLICLRMSGVANVTKVGNVGLAGGRHEVSLGCSYVLMLLRRSSLDQLVTL